MMRTLSLLIAFLLLFTASGLCWLLLFADTKTIAALFEALPLIYLSGGGKITIIALAFLTLGSSLTLLTVMLGLEPGARQPILIEGESGTVAMSLDAIEEFVKRKGGSVRGVRDLNVKAEFESGGLVVRNRVVLELQRNVPEFTKDFIGMLNHELKETLGLEQVKDVRLYIHKIVPKEGPKEPMLLAGPQPVVLKKDEEDDDDAESERGERYYDDEVVVISPQEFRGKE